MPKDLSHRLTIFAALLGAVTTLALLTLPVMAAPRGQQSLPNFRLDANTLISVTVAITDGQVIVVPIDLTVVGRNLGGEADLAVIAGVEQQTGIFIGVAIGENAPATVQLTDETGAVPTPAPTSSATAGDDTSTTGGTHVANVNSNLRAGPGTNFEIVGRVPAGGTVTIVGANEAGTWLQLDDGRWIAEFLVEPVATDNPGTDDAGDDTENEDTENEDSGDDGTENDATDGDDEENQTAQATPTALPTEVSTLSNQAALAIYLVSLAEIGANAGDAVSELNALLQFPQPLNAQWRNDVAAQLGVLSSALDQYLALTPVPGYEDVHAEVTSVALTCEQAVDYLIDGLESPRTIDPNVAVESMQACAAQATDLTDYLETIE